MTDAPALGVERSLTGRRWLWRAGAAAGEADAPAVPGVPALAAGLIRARAGADADVAQLAAPRLRDWLPPVEAIADLARAADRLAHAVTTGETIAILGDYDVDGATSTALLVRLLRACGATPMVHIPDRMAEGYGPSVPALRRLAEAGARVVVTVDCGAQAFEPLAAAQALGLDLVVADHHQCAAELPPAFAFINPNRPGHVPGFGHLAAVGVSFLLAAATVAALKARGWFAQRPTPDLLALLDLVALGTVADMVGLTTLNRAFVAQGLKVMAHRRNPGLAALLAVSRVEGAPDATALGFRLGPRVNAGGRVGEAGLGARLLATDCAQEAAAIAAELDRLNTERRAIEAEVQALALAEAEAQAQADAPVIVAAGPGWHPGVVGIVAGRLKEATGRPALVIDTETGKGSGRSIPGVDLGAAVTAAREAGLLAAGGGHAMAAGLTLGEGGCPRRLADFLAERLGADVAAARAGGARLTLDVAVAPAGLGADLADALDLAGPYGQGWPAPRVAVGPARIVDARTVGQGHLRLVLSGRDGARIKAVAFRSAEGPLGAALMAAAGSGGPALLLAGRVARDDWGGRRGAELRVEDAAVAG